VLTFTVKLANNNLSAVRKVCDSNENIKFLDKHNCWQISAFPAYLHLRLGWYKLLSQLCRIKRKQQKASHWQQEKCYKWVNL